LGSIADEPAQSDKIRIVAESGLRSIVQAGL